MRALIVEDECVIALDIEAALLADGHQVVGIATCEREALELANEADLAFVDVRLADGLTGPKIAQKLEKGFGVAVIYVTGNPDLIGDNEQGFEIVTKPHTKESIVEALRVEAARHSPVSGKWKSSGRTTTISAGADDPKPSTNQSRSHDRE
ncbi:response regulator [Rhizobium tubonense]|uniref:Response regulator n=1 Tax=Rhizobium tubonense TaxID=484088 RepID=A0A2W4CY85_9HYPH|nr:response regulator [Rhizobium tubonense]PZM16401.1 response regulator [Rhizobium tubonense]